MGVGIPQTCAPHPDYMDECRSTVHDDETCVRGTPKYDTIVQELDNQRSHPEPHDSTNGSWNKLINTVGHLPAGTFSQLRRVANYFLSRWERLLLIFRPWSVKDFLQELKAKFSLRREGVLGRLETGQRMLQDEPESHDNIEQGFRGFNEKGLPKILSTDDVPVQTGRSYESNNQEMDSKLEAKNATFDKTRLWQALEEARIELNDMKNGHIRDQDEIRQLRHLIHVVTEFQQSFSNDMTSIKNQTYQMIEDYDEKLVATVAAKDIASRKLEEAEKKLKSLNTSITAKDVSLSEAADREKRLKKRLDELEMKLKNAVATSNQRVLVTNDEIKPKVSSRADKPRLGRVLSVADNILHSLYNDALDRSATLEAENQELRASLTTTATTNSHNKGHKSQHAQRPTAPIKTAPTELIVIGVDIGRGMSNHLSSVKSVYRTILHYVSLNNSLALVSTVAHGCRGSHDVFVGPLDRPHLLALDTLNGLPAGGAPNYESCLASAHNVLAKDKALFASCRKVVILIGRALDQAPTKTLKGICHRFKEDGVQVHSLVVGSAAKADEDNLGIHWVAEKVGGRSLSDKAYLDALPSIVRHDG